MVSTRPVLARLRALLTAQVAPPRIVSARGTQYYFDEDSAAYAEIDVQDDRGFLIAVVLGDRPQTEFITRIWHRHAEEVWLLDHLDERIEIVTRAGFGQAFRRGELLRSARLPELAIPLELVFAVDN